MFSSSPSISPPSPLPLLSEDLQDPTLEVCCYQHPYCVQLRICDKNTFGEKGNCQKFNFPPTDGNLVVQFKAILSTCQNHKLFSLHIPNVCQSMVTMKTSAGMIFHDDDVEDNDKDHEDELVTFLRG